MVSSILTSYGASGCFVFSQDCIIIMVCSVPLLNWLKSQGLITKWQILIRRYHMIAYETTSFKRPRTWMLKKAQFTAFNIKKKSYHMMTFKSLQNMSVKTVKLIQLLFILSWHYLDINTRQTAGCQKDSKCFYLYRYLSDTYQIILAY